MEDAAVRNWGEPSAEQLANAPQDHLHIATVITDCNRLHGKVLTILDAVFANPAQCKAIKDLVRGVFREQMDHMADLSDENSTERPMRSAR